MNPKEFADRIANKEKFYDTVTGKIVTIEGLVDITGETYGKTDDGEIIKVNAKNLESTNQKSGDKRSDTEQLTDLLKEMGINPEDVGVNAKKIEGKEKANLRNNKENSKKILEAIKKGDILNTFVSVSTNKLMRIRQGLSKFEKADENKIARMLGEDEIGGIHYESVDKSNDGVVKVNIYIGEKIALEDFIKMIENKENHDGYDLDALKEKANNGNEQLVIRYKQDGTVDEIVPLLENDVVVSNKEELLQLHESILELSKEGKKVNGDAKITPQSVEKATEGEVTAPNFSKAITDITKAVKEDPEQGINKDENDGVTQADE